MTNKKSKRSWSNLNPHLFKIIFIVTCSKIDISIWPPELDSSTIISPTSTNSN